MSQYNFKKITTVHTADEFVNIMLSRTQRKTPTVIRRHYVISRIRKFYLVKVRFITEQFRERFSMLLDEFPKIDDLHPFYGELLNTIYNKEHYKIALGQINTAMHLITKIGADYSKLLKYGDSLFRCKKLKKAAMGRMVTVVKKQAPVFTYLEDVRQHLSRLPTIDPNERTLLICGCPNTGKSSFMNLVTSANVEVQSYAFTTKSIYVGHFDYDYLRWQVIDTPGILDRPFDEMNTIELQAITALTHIKAAILFFLDLSEMCDITVENQLKVFECINPLFSEKPMYLGLNKSDLMTLDRLAVEQPEKRAAIQRFEDKGVQVFELSTWTKAGVQELKNAACDKLLSHRINCKLQNRKAENIMNRVYVAMPKSDGKERPVFIPAKVQQNIAEKKYITKITDEAPDTKFEVHIEEEEEHFYTTDYCKNKDLENPEWKTDKIPRFYNGKNICDFITPNFEEELKKLEVEDKKLIESGYYDSDEDPYTEQDYVTVMLAKKITDKIIVNNINRRLDTGNSIQTINRASRARVRDRTTTNLRSKFEGLGVDMSDTGEALFTQVEKRPRSESRDKDGRDGSRAPSKRMRLDIAEKRVRSKSRTPRGTSGEADPEKREKLKVLLRMAVKRSQTKGTKNESDRHVFDLMPKHLNTGKRGLGSNQRR